MADQDTPSRKVPERVVSVYADGIRMQGVSGAVADGRKTVTTAGTAEQFSALDCRTVAITALSTNSGVVVIGASSVVAAAGTRRGTPLAASDTAIFAVSNMNLLWADVTVNGEGVSFTVMA